MSALVVDTCIWIDYFAGASMPGALRSQIDFALKEARVYLPPVVAAELLSARLGSKKREQLVDFVSSLHLVPSPLEHWLQVGIMREKLARKGIAISTPDAHVAQCVLDVGGVLDVGALGAEAVLLSSDKIFQRIKKPLGLKLA